MLRETSSTATLGCSCATASRLTSRDQRLRAVIRYFDPSYYIRSVPANTVDSVLCDSFARHAAHAAMAGKTDMIVGLQHGVFIHVPIPMATAERKRLSREEWAAVVTATGQPELV